MKIKQALINITLIFTIVLISCDKSVLSDVELSSEDAESLFVKIYIEQFYDNSRELLVRITDKKSRPVKLKNGFVSINGEECVFSGAEGGLAFPGLKGYVFYPNTQEQEFLIEIQYNSKDSWLLACDAKNGFPGFLRNTPIPDNTKYKDSYLTQSGQFNITNIPLYTRNIIVKYKILRTYSEIGI